MENTFDSFWGPRDNVFAVLVSFSITFTLRMKHVSYMSCVGKCIIIFLPLLALRVGVWYFNMILTFYVSLKTLRVPMSSHLYQQTCPPCLLTAYPSPNVMSKSWVKQVDHHRPDDIGSWAVITNWWFRFSLGVYRHATGDSYLTPVTVTKWFFFLSRYTAKLLFHVRAQWYIHIYKHFPK